MKLFKNSKNLSETEQYFQRQNTIHKFTGYCCFGLLGIFAIIVIAIAFSSGGDGSSSSEETSGTPKAYQEIFTFDGDGTKKSEPFTITGDRFKISYDCTGSFCQAFLYKTSGSMKGLIMNSPNAVKDETVIYGGGEYYIDANTIGSYTMTVYDYK